MRPLISLAFVLAFVVPAHSGGYPKVANLWGCSVVTTDYDKWAHYSLLVLGGGAQKQFRKLRASCAPATPTSSCSPRGSSPTPRRRR